MHGHCGQPIILSLILLPHNHRKNFIITTIVSVAILVLPIFYSSRTLVHKRQSIAIVFKSYFNMLQCLEVIHSKMIYFLHDNLKYLTKEKRTF